MTCIAVARQKNKKLIFSADRKVSSSTESYKSLRSKIRQEGDLIIGGAGDMHITLLVTYVMTIPDIPGKMSTFEYMANLFLPKMQKFLESRKIINTISSLGVITEDDTCDWLVGVRGDLFEINLRKDSCLSFSECETPYTIGSGGVLAWGSLLTTENSGITAKRRLQIAQEIVAKYVPSCGDGVDYLTEE